MIARSSAIETAATEPQDRALVITRLLDAPRSLAFKVWTQPEHVVRWLGPRGFTSPSCKMDVQPGGGYRASIRSREGTEIWMQGVYREVVEPERLVFTFAWEDDDGKPGFETLVTVTFEEQGDNTKLTFRQAVFDTTESRDSHDGGWNECFDRLEAYLATV